MPTRDPLENRTSVTPHAARRSDTAEQYRDLCSNCDNGSACDGRTRPRRPIFFCEEFVVFGAASAAESDRTEEKPSKKWSANGHIGLCTNCENARTCTLPKPQGGVWHCEEYR